ncbi:MAG: glycosyltransferase family 4 protein [Pirellulaceae bacterium]|nr:glycosyltransferase family 4 protein [Pirellulaceae bacterium]
MKKILFLLRHYPPDAGAPSYRLKHATSVAAENADVHVLVAQPNRYQGARAAPRREMLDGVNIHRVWHGQIFRSRGKFARGLTELLGALWMTLVALWTYRRVDVVVITTPPLLNSIPGYVMHRLFRKPLIVDLRDLWLDWAEESGVIRSRFAIRLLRAYERSLLCRADQITATTRSFKDLICERYGIAPDRVTVIYNGLDEIVRGEAVPADAKNGARDGFRRLLYAGNLGPSQNLLGIIQGCVESVGKWTNLEITIVGDGLQWQRLKQFDRPRLHVAGRVDREALRDLYAETDAFLLHLADLRVYEHTVPSKLFEYVSYGKTLLCGVTGEALEICRQYADCHEFRSDDPASLVLAVDRFMKGEPANNAEGPRSDVSTVLRANRSPLWRLVFNAVGRPSLDNPPESTDNAATTR